MALPVTPAIAAILATLDTELDTALGSGVSGNTVIGPGAYQQITDPALKQAIRNAFRLAFATLLQHVELKDP